MNITANYYIASLVDYSISRGLIVEEDRVYCINGLLSVLGLNEYTEPDRCDREECLETILANLLDVAEKKGLIPEGSVVSRDLLDTKLMGVLTPRPSEVIKEFFSLYKEDPKKATDYFYRLCLDCDYIREYRIKKDQKWKVPSPYGEIDITINLSKPEKDPKAIAAMKGKAQSGYPLCNLCHENVGYEGSLSQPARQTLRQIPLTLAGENWYLQYSPYSYYNEHCIALSASHTPMQVNLKLFDKALNFVEQFPHYFIGSNADLPIVGGSILTHDHMQGGDYSFAMANAKVEYKLVFDGFSDIEGEILHWPLSVIRLKGKSRERLCELGDKILQTWCEYSDPDAFIFAYTNGERHNTITPIARMRNGVLELDLVLRNNITTPEHPLGVFHPHAELHNIKKENIGLIEVMGLAVLPARLKQEMEQLRDVILSGEGISDDSPLAIHREWLASFADKYIFTEESTDKILKDEIGATFVRVLEHAGVYKCTEEGRAAFLRFTKNCGASEI